MLTTFFANDVRQTLDQFRRSVDHMFDNFYGQSQPAASNATGERTWTFSPVIETGWNENALSLRAILPGVAGPDTRSRNPYRRRQFDDELSYRFAFWSGAGGCMGIAGICYPSSAGLAGGDFRISRILVATTSR